MLKFILTIEKKNEIQKLNLNFYFLFFKKLKIDEKIRFLG